VHNLPSSPTCFLLTVYSYSTGWNFWKRFNPHEIVTIGLALRAYLRLELHRWRTRVSIFNSKLDIIRMAVGFYLAHPKYTILPTA
jgi:hypothetical protein